MLKQIEGSYAVADVVAMCRPNVISAYPITPQTHIVEGLALIVDEGRLEALYGNNFSRVVAYERSHLLYCRHAPACCVDLCQSGHIGTA
jgi:pyruvate/2-oxoacid:ferredoxin oxidoreductase alpha subunit